MKLIDFADQMNRVAQLIGNFCNLTVVQGKLIDPSNEINPRPFELSPRSFGFNIKKTRLEMNESSCRVFNGFCYSKLSIEAICSMKLFRIVDCFNQPLSFLKLLKTNKTQSIRSGNSLSCQSVVRMKEKTPSAN